MVETDLDLSHRIPSHLQGLVVPFPDDNRAWLWLSRLAFHFKRAFASLSAAAGLSLTVAVAEEAKDEILEKPATWVEESARRTHMNMKRI